MSEQFPPGPAQQPLDIETEMDFKNLSPGGDSTAAGQNKFKTPTQPNSPVKNEGSSFSATVSNESIPEEVPAGEIPGLIPPGSQERQQIHVEVPKHSEFDLVFAALVKNPHQPELWKRLVELAEVSGETDKIVKTYEELLKQYPNTVRAGATNFICFRCAIFREICVFNGFVRLELGSDCLHKSFSGRSAHFCQSRKLVPCVAKEFDECGLMEGISDIRSVRLFLSSFCHSRDTYTRFLLRRVNKDPSTRDSVRQSYEFALQHVGLDKDSGDIWAEYLQFLHSWDVGLTQQTRRILYSFLPKDLLYLARPAKDGFTPESIPPCSSNSAGECTCVLLRSSLPIYVPD